MVPGFCKSNYILASMTVLQFQKALTVLSGTNAYV